MNLSTINCFSYLNPFQSNHGIILCLDESLVVPILDSPVTNLLEDNNHQQLNLELDSMVPLLLHLLHLVVELKSLIWLTFLGHVHLLLLINEYLIKNESHSEFHSLIPHVDHPTLPKFELSLFLMSKIKYTIIILLICFRYLLTSLLYT